MKPTLEEMLAAPTDDQRQLLAAIVEEWERLRDECGGGTHLDIGKFIERTGELFDRLAAASKGEGAK